MNPANALRNDEAAAPTYERGIKYESALGGPVTGVPKDREEVVALGRLVSWR